MSNEITDFVDPSIEKCSGSPKIKCKPGQDLSHTVSVFNYSLKELVYSAVEKIILEKTINLAVVE